MKSALLALALLGAQQGSSETRGATGPMKREVAPTYPFKRLWERRDLSRAVWDPQTGVVAVSRKTREIVAVDPNTGRDRWRVLLPGQFAAGHIHIDALGEHVLTRTRDRTLTSYGAANGRQEWTARYPCVPVMVRSAGPTAVAACVMTESSAESYTAYEGKPAAIVVFDLESGAELWRLPWTVEVGHDWSGIPLSINDKLIVAARDPPRAAGSSLEAFEARTGRPLWTVPWPGQVSNIAIRAGVVLVGGIQVSGLDVVDGKLLWTSSPDPQLQLADELQMSMPHGDPAIFEGGLMRTRVGEIDGLDPRSGKVLRSWPLFARAHQPPAPLTPRAWVVGERLVVVLHWSWIPVPLGMVIVHGDTIRVFRPPTPRTRVLGAANGVLLMSERDDRTPLQGWSLTDLAPGAPRKH